MHFAQLLSRPFTFPGTGANHGFKNLLIPANGGKANHSFRDTLYRDLQAKSRVSKRTVRTELRHWYLERLQGRSKLSALINDSCRVRRKGADRCIYIGDSDVRRQALLWRSNSMGLHWKCLCGSPFTRSHINRCLRQELGLPEVAHSVKHYCALDEMLNECAYPEFQVAVRNLIDIIRRREDED